MSDSSGFFAECQALVDAGRLRDAAELASEALERTPDDGRVWIWAGLLRGRLGDFRGACDALEGASLLVPLGPEASLVLGQAYARLGKRELAAVVLTDLARGERCPTEMMGALAAALGSIGEDQPALDVCLDLTRHVPSCHEAHFGVAYYRRRLGAPVESIYPEVLRAHEIQPASPLYRITLATLLERFGQREEAYDLLRDVNPASVSCWCCLRRMAAIFRVAGDRQRGEACQARADRIAPADPSSGHASH